MKKYLLIPFLLFTMQIFAQEVEPQDAQPQGANAQIIETLRTAYITKELNLTSEEAQKFWPVYNEYAGEIKKVYAAHKDDIVTLEEKKVVVLKKYQESFKKILGTDDRVKKCFSAAPKFHQMLRKEWKRRIEMRRHNGGEGGPGNKPGFKPKDGPRNGGQSGPGRPEPRQH